MGGVDSFTVIGESGIGKSAAINRAISLMQGEKIIVTDNLSYGETAHLYEHGEPPAFAAWFCECWADETRHG